MSRRTIHLREPRRRDRRWVVWLVIGAVTLGAVLSAVAIATDQPQFCPTCHEMQPYYDAWRAGAHKDVSCVDCHVGRGLPRRFAHKFVALGEVWAHATGDIAFPMQSAAEVPDPRCETCHERVRPKDVPPSFDHLAHAEGRPCQLCHESAGHRVGNADLKRAGVFDAANAAARARSEIKPNAVANPGRGAANLPGHTWVPCSKCHDMAKTGCPACHSAPAKHRFKGDCGRCHRPGSAFAFAHPKKGDCRECHKPPASNHPSNDQCTECHSDIGASWKFSHPDNGDCGQCHRVPGGKHPSSADCARCHTQAGRSWAFVHRGDTGEHTYRSFPCAKCHPTDYDSATCTCHKNGVPSD